MTPLETTLVTETAKEIVKAIIAGAAEWLKRLPELWARYGPGKQREVAEELARSTAQFAALPPQAVAAQALMETGRWEVRLSALIADHPEAAAALAQYRASLAANVRQDPRISADVRAKHDAFAVTGIITGSRIKQKKTELKIGRFKIGTGGIAAVLAGAVLFGGAAGYTACAVTHHDPEAAHALFVDGGGDGGRVPSTGPSRPAPGDFDPPREFYSVPVDLSGVPDDYAVLGHVVYYYQQGDTLTVTATSLADGTRLWTHPIGESGAATGPLTAPRVSDVPGRRLVIAEYTVPVWGSGTTRSTFYLRYLALDADTGATVWTSDVDRDAVPESYREADIFMYSPGLNAVDTIAAVGDGNIVADIGGADDDWLTLVIAASDGTIVRTVENFHGDAVNAGVVAGRVNTGKSLGSTTVAIAGISVATGQEAWRHDNADDPELRWEGHMYAMQIDARYLEASGGFDSFLTVVLDIATGTEQLRLSDNYQRYHCRFDLDGVYVCVLSKVGWADTPIQVEGWRTGADKALWAIGDKDPDRRMPTAIALRHGVLYGDVDGDGLMLDAATGKDTGTALPAVPDLVIPGFLLARTGAGLSAYIATA